MQPVPTFHSQTKGTSSGHANFVAVLQTLITKFGVLFLNAGTSVIVARVLGPEGRGQMSAIIMWSAFLTGLLTLGIPSSLVFNLRRSPDNARRLVAAGLSLAVIVSVLIGLVGYIAIPLWLAHFSASAVSEARWFLLASPLTIFISVGRASIESAGKFRISNVVFWMGPLIVIIGLVLLAFTHLLTPLTAGLVYVLSNVPPAFWLLKHVIHLYNPQFSHLQRSMTHLLNYGFRSWGIDLLGALGGQADQVLIIHFLSAQTMGTYVVVASLARILGAIEASASMVLFPTIAAKNNATIIELTGQALRITTIITAIGAAGIGIIGPLLLSVIYGKRYAGGVEVFRVLLAEVVLAGATQMLAQAFMAFGKPTVITCVQGIGVFLALSLMIVLIPHFGIMGAGVALLFATTTRFLVTLALFKPVLGVRPPGFLITFGDLKLLQSNFARLLPTRT